MLRVRHGFTLIELLVVIAIIAILAAILFPVFAQAKEAAKKTAALSGIKQLGTAQQIYLADNEDTFPLTNVFYDFGGGLVASQQSLAYPFPQGWIDDWTISTPQDIAFCSGFYANSVAPYMKSVQLPEATGLTNEYLFPGYDTGSPKLKEPGNMGLLMNGLMHGLSSSAVDNPSMVPLLWGGNGNYNWKGRSTANPQMDCGYSFSGATNCQFNPNGTPGPSQWSGQTYWFWGNVPDTGAGVVPKAALYSGSTLVVRTDSSAKSYKLSSGSTATNTNILEPWSQYDAQGAPTNMRFCSSNTSDDAAWQPCFFRPDQDGTRDKWEGILE